MREYPEKNFVVFKIDGKLSVAKAIDVFFFRKKVKLRVVCFQPIFPDDYFKEPRVYNMSFHSKDPYY